MFATPTSGQTILCLVYPRIHHTYFHDFPILILRATGLVVRLRVAIILTYIKYLKEFAIHVWSRSSPVIAHQTVV